MILLTMNLLVQIPVVTGDLMGVMMGAYMNAIETVNYGLIYIRKISIMMVFLFGLR